MSGPVNGQPFVADNGRPNAKANLSATLRWTFFETAIENKATAGLDYMRSV